MNLRVVGKMLGIVSILMGAMMLFSLPWAHPWLGYHTTSLHDHSIAENTHFESKGALALLASMLICFSVGSLLIWVGRQTNGRLFRKEAMAVVGLSWALASILGSLPFYLSGTIRGPSIRIQGADAPLLVSRFNWTPWSEWREFSVDSDEEYQLLEALCHSPSPAFGLTADEIREQTGISDPASIVNQMRARDALWKKLLILPGEEKFPEDRVNNYRIRWVPMGLVDSIFEAQSGFSTTGATVISDLEDPFLVPHCILFWRSSTHFLGGLGIIVLFVAILGQGTSGKALMRAEMPGPTKDGSTARMQHTAIRFASIYCGLTIVLTIALCLCGMNLFDAVCHAFGTMATGGFSTYNASIGHFDSVTIDYLITLFMVLAGTNFTLLYFTFTGSPRRLLRDIEWRTYIAMIVFITLAIVVVGYSAGYPKFDNLFSSLRYGLFQVVSILTTTGYGTADFDQWRPFGRGGLLLLMFIGGCAGSTGGGMKIVRHILFVKILRLELEKSFHPRVVRFLWIGSNSIEDQNLRQHIMIYFALIMTIFASSWLAVVAFEPTTTWGVDANDKLIDSAGAVAAMLNNIGPGIGTVGPTENYGHFSGFSKMLFAWLMILGRIEIFPMLVLFFARFWRPF